MRTRLSSGRKGFTLIELLVTISIAAILLAIGIPSFSQFVISNRLTAENNNLAAMLNIARSEAVRRGTRVTVRSTAGGGNWGNGWSMFVDSNGNGTKDADPADPVLRTGSAISTSLTLYSSASYANFITFLSSGQSNAAGLFMLCHGGDNTQSRAIIVSATGRIRTGRDSGGDGIPENDAGANITSCTNP